MTFSIVARSDDGESWGIAVASKALAVGAIVTAAVAEVGAIATQSYANVAFKGQALAHLDEGANASIAMQRLIEEDAGRDLRQVGLVDVEGGSATYTGSACIEWAGGTNAEGYAVQGNCLTGPEVIDAMEATWLAGAAADTELSFAQRLLAALEAGEAAGGDARGRQAAALLVVRAGAGYDGGDDIEVDLRVDDHEEPLVELVRLLSLWETLTAEEAAEAAAAERTAETD